MCGAEQYWQHDGETGLVQARPGGGRQRLPGRVEGEGGRERETRLDCSPHCELVRVVQYKKAGLAGGAGRRLVWRLRGEEEEGRQGCWRCGERAESRCVGM